MHRFYCWKHNCQVGCLMINTSIYIDKAVNLMHQVLNIHAFMLKTGKICTIIKSLIQKNSLFIYIDLFNSLFSMKQIYFLFTSWILYYKLISNIFLNKKVAIIQPTRERNCPVHANWQQWPFRGTVSLLYTSSDTHQHVWNTV